MDNHASGQISENPAQTPETPQTQPTNIAPSTTENTQLPPPSTKAPDKKTNRVAMIIAIVMSVIFILGLPILYGIIYISYSLYAVTSGRPHALTSESDVTTYLTKKYPNDEFSILDCDIRKKGGRNHCKVTSQKSNLTFEVYDYKPNFGPFPEYVITDNYYKITIEHLEETQPTTAHFKIVINDTDRFSLIDKNTGEIAVLEQYDVDTFANEVLQFCSEARKMPLFNHFEPESLRELDYQYVKSDPKTPFYSTVKCNFGTISLDSIKSQLTE